MKTDLIFLIVLVFVVAYVFALYKIETMSDVSNIDQIKEAVKEIYLADVEAIRNLSNVATQLQKEGLTVPGNLISKGVISLGNQDNPHPDNADGAFYRAEGQVQIATDDLLRIRHVGSKSTGIQFDVREGAGDIQNPNGQMKISRQGIMFGGHNNNKETNSGQINAGLHIPNSLNIVGVSENKDATTRRIDMWAEKGLNVYGPTNINGDINTNGVVKIGNSVITENILKRILPLQSYAGFAVDGDGTTMLLYEGEYNLLDGAQFDAWTSDRWDVIYINRGWQITLWHHRIGDSQAAVGENKTSNVPLKLKIPANTISSYRAEWIGY